MGHERVGLLPKTKRWSDLVRQMEAVSSSSLPVATVASQTLQNVRRQYETLFKDDAVRSTFAFLVAFSHACRASNPEQELKASGIPISENSNLLSLVRTLKEQIPTREAVSEYGQLALAAAADAIGQWYAQNATRQLPLFKPSSQFLSSWRELGNGSGFCELARLFFGKVTERYLNYFLDRTASATLPSIEQREQFRQDVRSHVDAVSKHAFETAEITQSFAAGWFNAHARDKIPTTEEIEGFLAIAFGKLRDELRREEEAK
jgi:hypothetical protein